MREIIDSEGDVYCYVSVEQRLGLLQIVLNKGSGAGYTINLDAKIIPQLKNILAEAEFFKHI